MLINERERKFECHFTLEMKPDIGEINFDVECILESPEQQKVEFVIYNAPKVISDFITPFILKNSYKEAEKIGKSEGISFPPVEQILKI
jgi:hypothetical protein